MISLHLTEYCENEAMSIKHSDANLISTIGKLMKEGISYFFFKAGFEQCAVNKALSHTLSNEAISKY